MFEPAMLAKMDFAEHAGVPVDEVLDRRAGERHRAAFLAYCGARSQREYDVMIIEQIRALDPSVRFVFVGVSRRSQINTYGSAFSVMIHMRVHASDETRARRGWVRSAVDDDATETELDDVPVWPVYRLTNDESGDDVCRRFREVLLL